MKRCTLLLVLIISAAALHSQNIPRPVFLKINMEGAVVPVTLDPFAPIPQEYFREATDSAVTCNILSTCTHHGETDTSREVRHGALSDFRFEHHTYQRELATLTLYPEVMHPNFGVSFFYLNDTLSTRNYFVDGWVCGNGGHYQYNIKEQWIYGKDHQLKTVIAHNPLYADTTSIVYNYEWLPTGQLRMLTVVSSVFIYEKWRRDTVTIEVVYDKKLRPVTQVAYVGGKIDSLSQSIKDWTAQIQSHGFSYYNGKPKDRHGVLATYLLVYTYENDLLQSAFVYDNQWSASFADTLKYDAKGRIISYRSYFNTDFTDIAYTYNKKGQVLTKHETTTVIDGDGTIRQDGEATETYSYDSKKRINRIDYFWPDDTYPNKVVATITYR